MSTWRSANFCVECEAELSLYAASRNAGVCPACGHRSKYSPTIAETYTRAFRYLPRSKWWRFWEPKRRQYKDVT